MGLILQLYSDLLVPAVDSDMDLGSITNRFNDLYLGGKNYIGDSSLYISSENDGHLDLTADISIDLNANVSLGSNNLSTSGTITSSSYKLSDSSDKNYTLSVYASGTAYSLTITSALLTFGTTSPSLTIDKAGTYRIYARAQVTRNNSSHVSSHTISFKLRRTNNTAADITNSTTTFSDDAHSTSYETEHQDILPEIIYTTSNTDDIIQLWGVASSAGTGGTHDVDEACIVAERLY